MANRRRQPVERSQRWQREDAAPRLSAVVPNLKTLALALKDAVDDRSAALNSRIQHIIVARAAALFEVACSEPKCEGGGYDLTSDVLYALQRGETSFQGTSQCLGSIGQQGCRRVLYYTAEATYVDS